MNAVVQVEPRAQAVALIDAIERAALNPEVDVDKMDRLLQMQERILSRQAEAAFNESMLGAQEEMKPISADAKNDQTKSRYATYAKLDSVLRPIYAKHGFSLSFDTDESPKGPEWLRVLCYVAHRTGHTRTYKIDMPADGKGAKGGDVMTKTHAVGAAASYGNRYLLKGIFNVAIGEEDKDGNDPRQEPTLTETQVADMTALLSETGANKAAFLKAIKCARLEDIWQKNYDYLCREIRARKSR